ncbi:hypothetical protein NDU88_002385 [Pleurodeles waltl]|uniref:Uncharacterized protein n=1 Tax=Pleurodeles waltl TaxID=8319 RepID=A0AAV7M0E4_PLEWA|nr:hypothetical protein NDU88_002385 [Pleurodeles waltl]
MPVSALCLNLAHIGTCQLQRGPGRQAQHWARQLGAPVFWMALEPRLRQRSRARAGPAICCSGRGLQRRAIQCGSTVWQEALPPCTLLLQSARWAWATTGISSCTQGYEELVRSQEVARTGGVVEASPAGDTGHTRA